MLEEREHEKAQLRFLAFGESVADHLLDPKLKDTFFEHKTKTTKAGSVEHTYTIRVWLKNGDDDEDSAGGSTGESGLDGDGPGPV